MPACQCGRLFKFLILPARACHCQARARRVWRRALVPLRVRAQPGGWHFVDCRDVLAQFARQFPGPGRVTGRHSS